MTAPSSSALLAIEKRAATIVRKLFDDGELSGVQVCRRCGAVVDPGYAAFTPDGTHTEVGLSRARRWLDGGPTDLVVMAQSGRCLIRAGRG